MATSRASSIERRVHPRFAARELRGLHVARVKYGQDITIINLSAGGVSFETAAQLTANATLVLEFLGPANASLIPSRVLRCQRPPAFESAARARGACAFRRLLRLKDLVTGTTLPFDELSLEGTASWQEVVGKCRDGRLVRGYTRDFSPLRTYLHVSPAPAAKESQFVSLNDLDALFIMRDPAPADGGDAVMARESGTPYGRKVALVLPSGEDLVGSTLNYSRDGNGFFIHPSDNDFGVARVFVTQRGIRSVRFL